MKNAAYWIEKLQMQKHPEGGYYKETYRSSGVIHQESLPVVMTGSRNYCTGIYFLLENGNFSAFHRIRSDEMWHFYSGTAIEILYFDEEGKLQKILLGNRMELGEQFQAVVPANCWFASAVVESDSFALVGCTVAPGFDYADFELAQRAQLIQNYPAYSEVIEKFTRG